MVKGRSRRGRRVVAVEVERAQLSIAFAERQGDKLRIVEFRRRALQPGSELLAELADAMQGAAPVDEALVAFLDRRTVHLQLVLPARVDPLRSGVLEREARRFRRLSDGPVLMGARQLGETSAGGKHWGCWASPAEALPDLQLLGAVLGCKRLEVTSMADAASRLAFRPGPGSEDPSDSSERGQTSAELTWLVRRGASNVKLAAVERGGVIDERRLILPTGSDLRASLDEDLLGILMMELPRTADYLRRAGRPIPERLLVDADLELGEMTLEMLGAVAGMGAAVLPMPEAVELGDGVLLDRALPSLGLLDSWQRGIDPIRNYSPTEEGKQVPVLPSRRVAVLAAAALVPLVLAGVTVLFERSATQRALADAERYQAAAREGAEPDHGPDLRPEPETEVVSALPLDEVFAGVWQNCPSSITLHRLEVDATSGLVVAGSVAGDDLRTALQSLDAYTERLAALPGLATPRQEFSTRDAATEDEVPGASARGADLEFTFSAAWRQR